MNISKLGVFGACIALTSVAAQAGEAPAASVGGSLNIVDAGGFSWNLDLTGLLKVDPVTGAVSTNSSALGADSNGNWLLSANTSNVKVYDSATDSYLTPTQLVRWHSWVRADGSTAQGAAGNPENPWLAQFSFAVGGNVDPYIAYGFSVRNTGLSTQTYSYSQGQSIVPAIASPYTIYADVAGSIVNTTQVTATATLAPVGGSGAKVQSVKLGNAGSATVNAGVDVGDAITTSTTGSSTYGVYSSFAAGAGSYDYWTITSTFTVSGGDVVTLSGYAEITPIPEPQTYALFAAGLLALGMMVSRRSQKR